MFISRDLSRAPLCWRVSISRDLSEVLLCWCVWQVSTRLVGLALAHVLNMSGMMQWAVRQTAETENDMTSVERMLEYTKLPQVSPQPFDIAYNVLL